MRPDVDGFVMHVEERGEGSPVAIAIRAVTREDKVVIAAPSRQVVPQDEQGRGNLVFYILSNLCEC